MTDKQAKFFGVFMAILIVLMLGLMGRTMYLLTHPKEIHHAE